MRPDPPDPLTFEEHRELACELRGASKRLRELCAIVADIYGPNNQAAFSFGKAVEAVDRLCADMRAQAAQDCPGRDGAHLYE
jgi:hypothetical protein